MFELRYRGLVISGTLLILLSFMLVASGGSRADATGVWTSTVPGEGYFDSTWPADFTYDAKLTLNAGGSGSLWLKCTDVVINQAGWESALGMEGKSQTLSVDYTVLGSTVTVTIHDNYGGSYALPVTLSGNRLSGSGQYTDISYTVNSWSMDLTRGGSSSVGLPGLGGAIAPLAIGAGLMGLGVSLLPPPRYMGGSIIPQSTSPLGTPYAPSQSLVQNHQISSMANQRGGVTKPIPDVPKMRMHLDPIQFPNVEMGKTTQVQPTEVRPTDVLAKRGCPVCGSTLVFTGRGWSCPFCSWAPPGGLDP